jgi:hypothetical protein
MLLGERVVGLEINTEETKQMVMTGHQNAGLNRNLMTANTFGEMRNAYRILVGKPYGKISLEDLDGVDGKIILEWILGK